MIDTDLEVKEGSKWRMHERVVKSQGRSGAWVCGQAHTTMGLRLEVRGLGTRTVAQEIKGKKHGCRWLDSFWLADLTIEVVALLEGNALRARLALEFYM